MLLNGKTLTVDSLGQLVLIRSSFVDTKLVAIFINYILRYNVPIHICNYFCISYI